MNLNQRITDRATATHLADLTRAVLVALLAGEDVELLDCLDELTEASIALRTTIATQLDGTHQ